MLGNPDLLRAIGVGPILIGLSTPQARNDTELDEALRSVLFQVPKPGLRATDCGVAHTSPRCFSAVEDLGAADVQRGRDHGIPPYNVLRRAYGLTPARRFTDVTGESSEALPHRFRADARGMLSVTRLETATGHWLPARDVGPAAEPIAAVRATTLAARLKAVYGGVTDLDPIVGMLAERHLSGSDLGPLQTAILRKQFEALRDGDRFFYLADPMLDTIRRRYGIDYRHGLASIVTLNTRQRLPTYVFRR
jgi:hypothetical protein